MKHKPGTSQGVPGQYARVCRPWQGAVAGQYLPCPGTNHHPPPLPLPHAKSPRTFRSPSHGQAHSPTRPLPRATNTTSTTTPRHKPTVPPPQLPRKPSKTAAPNQPPTLPGNRTAAGVGQDGAAEQHGDRDPERADLPPVRPHPRRRHLAARARRRHGVRAVPRGALHRARRRPHARLPRGARRRLLPRHLPPLVLPRRHVPPHRRRLRDHRLRLRRHQQGRRPGRLRPRDQRVQARGLLQLAAEEGAERQELEPDQDLPPGRQVLQVPREQAGHAQQVPQQRPLPHPVRLLQASDQLRLQLRQRHAVERRPQRDLGTGLQHVGQRRLEALLRLPVVQGRRCGHAEEGLEALRHHQHRLPRLHRHRLLHRLLRLQEQPPRPPQRLQAERIRLIVRLEPAAWPRR